MRMYFSYMDLTIKDYKEIFIKKISNLGYYKELKKENSNDKKYEEKYEYIRINNIKYCTWIHRIYKCCY